MPVTVRQRGLIVSWNAETDRCAHLTATLRYMIEINSHPPPHPHKPAAVVRIESGHDCRFLPPGHIIPGQASFTAWCE